MKKKLTVSGVGCCLVDRLYSNIPFDEKRFRPYRSVPRGDGGLTSGHLAFKEEFEAFAGKKFSLALEEITEGRPPDKINIGALIITNGSNPIRAFSSGRFLRILDECELPVSKAVSDQLKKGHSGDTTGCGDNFAGGVIASLVLQLQAGNNQPDLKEACIWGIVSGGFSCFYMGGTYFEAFPGEKRNKIEPYYEQYQNQ